MAEASPQKEFAPRQGKPKATGLPDPLKAGVEHLSGFAMDDVKVHYNSAKPAAVQALAYTQGTDIHVGPGQEQHLPHEAWHVVQQKQGRVKPTLQLKGVAINDDAALEGEADQQGANSLRQGLGPPTEATPPMWRTNPVSKPPLQMMTSDDEEKQPAHAAAPPLPMDVVRIVRGFSNQRDMTNLGRTSRDLHASVSSVADEKRAEGAAHIQLTNIENELDRRTTDVSKLIEAYKGLDEEKLRSAYASLAASKKTTARIYRRALESIETQIVHLNETMEAKNVDRQMLGPRTSSCLARIRELKLSLSKNILDD
jgi:hypothetical protein